MNLNPNLFNTKLLMPDSFLQNIADGKIDFSNLTQNTQGAAAQQEQGAAAQQEQGLDTFKTEMSTLFENEMLSDWDKFSEKHGDGFSSYPSKTKLIEVVNSIINNATLESTEETLRTEIHSTNAYKNMKNAAEADLSSYKTKRNLAIGGGVLLVGGVVAFVMLKKK